MKLTTTELGKRWRTDSRTVRRAIGRGELRATFIGGQWLVEDTDAEEYERSRTNVAPEKPKRTRRPRARGRVTA